MDQLAHDWEATRRSSGSRRAARRLSDAEPDIAATGAADLGELVDGLREINRPGGRERAAHTVRAMLRSGSVDPLVPRAIVQAMIPGLVTVARRLSWGAGGDWSDGGAFFADLIATAWELVCEWCGQDRPYAVLDLLSAVRCRVRRQIERRRTDGQRVSLGIEPEDYTLPPAPDDATTLDRLAQAIEEVWGNGLDPVDAAILYGHRVLGLSMAELSRITGRTRRQLDGRRHRAEERLCA